MSSTPRPIFANPRACKRAREPLGEHFAARADADDIERLIGVERGRYASGELLDDPLHVGLVVTVPHRAAERKEKVGKRQTQPATRSARRGEGTLCYS